MSHGHLWGHRKVLKFMLLGGWEHVWIMTFHSVGNFIIPTDELIFFRGVRIPPTSMLVHGISDGNFVLKRGIPGQKWPNDQSIGYLNDLTRHAFWVRWTERWMLVFLPVGLTNDTGISPTYSRRYVVEAECFAIANCSLFLLHMS